MTTANNRSSNDDTGGDTPARRPPQTPAGARAPRADAGIRVFSAPRDCYPVAAFARSMDPQLVDEDRQVGAELVVADPGGKHDQGPWVVDRHPRSLAHDLVVDARPEGPGRTGI